MRITPLVLPVVLAAGLLTLGCRLSINGKAAASNRSNRQAEVTFTEEQERLIRKYVNFKRRILGYLGLDETASPEAIKHAILSKLEMPSASSWEAIEAKVLSEPVAREALTEEKRAQFTTVFKLPPDTTWRGLWEALEEYVKKDAYARSK